MDEYAPEFSALWDDEASRVPARENAQGLPKQGLSTSQELALEELAERITAARSIV